MKKVLVIGIKGMAGHVLFNKLRMNSDFEVFGIARNIAPANNVFNLDVSDTAGLRTLIEKYAFDYIINCIGILNRDAEDHPSKAIWFNSFFPHFLADVTKMSDTRIIHISTDCVFSGARGNYTENDVKDGKGYYAQSKALGELDNDKDLTIRTSIIGPELNPNGIGLFHWFMSQGHDATLKGYSQAFWSGITTVELANVISFIIREGGLKGLLQVAPGKKIDKYALLKLFNEIYRQNTLEVIEDQTYKVDKSLKSLRTDFKYSVPDYRTMLLEMKDWMSRSKLYNYL